MPTPGQKTDILESSLRCFVLGLFSLIPLIGAGFAVGALRAHAKVRSEITQGWNPAERYLRWGCALAWIGVLLALALLGLVGLAVVGSLDLL